MLFSWQRRSTEPQPKAEAPVFLKLMKKSDQDWSDFLDSKGWPSIKIWFSDTQLNEVDGLADYRDQTRSEVLRDLLFIALYGHYTYAQLMIECRGLPREPGRIPAAERSFFESELAPYKSSQIGTLSKRPPKKTENLRLFLPGRMKRDINRIAKANSSTMSETALELIQVVTKGLALRD